MLALRATGVLRRIRVRNGGGLAIRRHQRGDSRECDHRSLQADSEHHDDSDELTLHDEDVNTPPSFALPKRDFSADMLLVLATRVGLRPTLKLAA